MDSSENRREAGGASLSPEEVAAFWRDGFVGPFPIDLGADQVEDMADRLSAIVVERQRSPLYGRYAQRDWHLIDPELELLLTQDAIIGRVASLLGENLLLWRSKIFSKAPGASAIGWHQEWGLFDGEEIGNSTPSLQPVDASEGIWDLTVWVALDEVLEDNGPLQFAPGSHRVRVPWEKVPMTESAFYEEPYDALSTDEIIERTRRSELVLDIETADWLDNFDTDGATREQLIDYLHGRFAELKAKLTHFEPESVVSMVMPPGHFVIFSERTMHGSPPNLSSKRRTAVNCRIATADTLVYPGRLTGEFIDGSNLDVRRHENLLVSGRMIEQRNVWRDASRKVRVGSRPPA